MNLLLQQNQNYLKQHGLAPVQVQTPMDHSAVLDSINMFKTDFNSKVEQDLGSNERLYSKIIMLGGSSIAFSFDTDKKAAVNYHNIERLRLSKVPPEIFPSRHSVTVECVITLKDEVMFLACGKVVDATTPALKNINFEKKKFHIISSKMDNHAAAIRSELFTSFYKALGNTVIGLHGHIVMELNGQSIDGINDLEKLLPSDLEMDKFNSSVYIKSLPQMRLGVKVPFALLTKAADFGAGFLATIIPIGEKGFVFWKSYAVLDDYAQEQAFTTSHHQMLQMGGSASDPKNIPLEGKWVDLWSGVPMATQVVEGVCYVAVNTVRASNISAELAGTMLHENLDFCARTIRTFTKHFGGSTDVHTCLTELERSIYFVPIASGRQMKCSNNGIITEFETSKVVAANYSAGEIQAMRLILSLYYVASVTHGKLNIESFSPFRLMLNLWTYDPKKSFSIPFQPHMAAFFLHHASFRSTSTALKEHFGVTGKDFIESMYKQCIRSPDLLHIWRESENQSDLQELTPDEVKVRSKIPGFYSFFGIPVCVVQYAVNKRKPKFRVLVGLGTRMSSVFASGKASSKMIGASQNSMVLSWGRYVAKANGVEFLL
jgi:hypothetical protein